MKIQAENIWLTIDEVCDLSGDKKETIRRKCKSGELVSTFEKIGKFKNYFVSLSSLKAFIESKNYLDRNAKVGRDDIQKLSGALQVLTTIDKGIFASATDYTKPAVQYSKDLVSAGQKNIDLYIIRPVKDEDTEGRMMGLVLEIHAQIPHIEIKNIQWGQEGKDKLKSMGIKEGEQHQYLLQYIYDANHNVITELNNLYQDAQRTGVIGDSSWDFENAFIEVYGELVPFEKILYNLTYSTAISKSEMHFNPVIYVKSTDGSIERLIDAEDLKKSYLKIKDNK